MVQRKGVKHGFQTNQTVRYNSSFEKNSSKIKFPDSRIDYSLDKNKRWENVDQIIEEYNNSQITSPETTKMSKKTLREIQRESFENCDNSRQKSKLEKKILREQRRKEREEQERKERGEEKEEEKKEEITVILISNQEEIKRNFKFLQSNSLSEKDKILILKPKKSSHQNNYCHLESEHINYHFDNKKSEKGCRASQASMKNLFV